MNGLEKVNILIVDDRADKLLALETVLESLGQNLVKATSGQEALRAMLAMDFAVVLLDVSMPIMDGFETASLIRQRPRSEHTPIIFITSINTSETHVTKGYSIGAVDYIFAPVEPEILRSKVSVFVELFIKREQIKIQSELLRKQAEMRAEILDSRLQKLLNELNVGVFTITSTGRLLEGNPAFLRLLGYDSIEEFDEGPTRNVLDEIADGALESCRSGKRTADIEIRSPGKLSWIAITPIAVRDGKGSTVIEGLAEDITERKRSERALMNINEVLEKRVIERTEALKVSQEHLRRTERLASLGTLAAGIAHEINNPLNSILLAAQYALRKPNDSALLLKCLEVVSSETTRCGKIIQNVLQFARNEKKGRAAEDINDIVLRAVELVKTYVATPPSIELKQCAKPLLCMVTRTEIEQVFINILKNAIEASEDECAIVVTAKEGEGLIRIEIKDNGPGMVPSVLENIFDPFFTTKTSKGGTGLGLSVAHGIINDHGGKIFAQSALGEGSTFFVELPLYRTEREYVQSEYKENGHVFSS